MVEMDITAPLPFQRQVFMMDTDGIFPLKVQLIQSWSWSFRKENMRGFLSPSHLSVVSVVWQSVTSTCSCEKLSYCLKWCKHKHIQNSKTTKSDWVWALPGLCVELQIVLYSLWARWEWLQAEAVVICINYYFLSSVITVKEVIPASIFVKSSSGGTWTAGSSCERIVRLVLSRA